MPNPNWSALLSSLLAIFSSTQLPPQPPTAPPSDLIWTTVLSQAPPAGNPPGGSRGNGEGVIPFAPGVIGKPEIWGNMPLFLWQGAVRQLEVIQTATGELIWSQRLTVTDQPTVQSCLYTGKPLESGAYAWSLYTPAKVAITRVAFSIMQAAEQSPIAAALAALETQLTEATPEQRALQRANYFATQQLWSDVFREAFTVDNPSDELKTLRSTLSNLLLKSS